MQAACCALIQEKSSSHQELTNPLWDVPPLMNSGITYGHYKRGGQSIDTHRVVDTPRPSTLGMIVARGREQSEL